MSPDVARTSDFGSRSNASSTRAVGQDGGVRALIGRHDSRTPAGLEPIAALSQVWMSNCARIRPVLSAHSSLLEDAVAARAVVLAHLGLPQIRGACRS